MKCLRQFVDLFVHGHAESLAIGLHHLAGKQGHLFGFELQVAQQVVVHLLHHAGPLGVAGVRLALVHEHTLDHALLLRLFGQRHEAFIRIVVIGGEHRFHPSRRPFYIGLDAVVEESLYMDASDSHGDDAHAHILGQVFCQCSSEVVDRRESGVLTAERRQGLVPLAHFPAALRIVDGSHHLEPVVQALQVLRFGSCRSLHVRLSEAEEDVEVVVRCRTHSQHRKGEECYYKKNSSHILLYLLIMFHEFLFCRKGNI